MSKANHFDPPLIDNANKCDPAMIASFDSTQARINAAHIPYNFILRNSNSAANTTLRQAGLPGLPHSLRAIAGDGDLSIWFKKE